MGELLGIARPAGDDTRETETGRNLQVISNLEELFEHDRGVFGGST